MQERQEALAAAVAFHLQRVQQSLQHVASDAAHAFWQHQGHQGRLAALGCLSHSQAVYARRCFLCIVHVIFRFVLQMSFLPTKEKLSGPFYVLPFYQSQPVLMKAFPKAM